MSFNRRRELLFLYTVKDANPNGDPLNANHPRFDAETSQILVSDVRIKRTIRDEWLREGLVARGCPGAEELNLKRNLM